jgi:hypothetical protein
MAKTTVRAELEYFIVDYADEDAGLFVQTGYFTTEEAAQERAAILETKEQIGLEDLAGDVTE